MEQKYLTSAKLDKKLTFLLFTATKWYNSEITKTTSTRQDKHTTYIVLTIDSSDVDVGIPS